MTKMSKQIVPVQGLRKKKKSRENDIPPYIKRTYDIQELFLASHRKWGK